jgi:hypothetical protein
MQADDLWPYLVGAILGLILFALVCICAILLETWLAKRRKRIEAGPDGGGARRRIDTETRREWGERPRNVPGSSLGTRIGDRLK